MINIDKNENNNLVLSIVIPNKEDGRRVTVSSHRYLILKDNSDRLQRALHFRMQRCVAQLASNLDNIKCSDGMYVAYSNGHFSYPAYKAMQEFLIALETQAYGTVFSTLAYQQMIKAIEELLMFGDVANDRHEYANVLDYLHECLLVAKVEHRVD